MTWFEKLTGCPEQSPAQVRAELSVQGARLCSPRSGKSWRFGELEMPTLAQLRDRARSGTNARRQMTVREIVTDVQQLHADEGNAGALFQVASQFNLLEMTGPKRTPEDGISVYEFDRTQGPACAIAAGAGTIFRNYFVNVNGQIGQSADNQIDCLAGVGALLGNSDSRLWRMVNGYVLPTATGLAEIDQRLAAMGERELDSLRQALQIGLQWDTQVTLNEATHLVSQAYCSALPVAYCDHPPELWARFAMLVLEAAYEATVCAAIINAQRTNNRTLFLTTLGGGAFGNHPKWIMAGLRRALNLYSDSGLSVAIVSYGASNPHVQLLVLEYNQTRSHSDST